MGVKYSVLSGSASIAASTTKVACQIASGATVRARIIGIDVSFDSVATGAGATPFRVELVRCTGASSGGSTFTPIEWFTVDIAATLTARINDTTDGASPSIIKSWFISPTSGISQQLPLGREVEIAASEFYEVRIITPAGITTCNYEVCVDVEE